MDCTQYFAWEDQREIQEANLDSKILKRREQPLKIITIMVVRLGNTVSQWQSKIHANARESGGMPTKIECVITIEGCIKRLSRIA